MSQKESGHAQLPVSEWLLILSDPEGNTLFSLADGEPTRAEGRFSLMVMTNSKHACGGAAEKAGHALLSTDTDLI